MERISCISRMVNARILAQSGEIVQDQSGEAGKSFDGLSRSDGHVHPAVQGFHYFILQLADLLVGIGIGLLRDVKDASVQLVDLGPA